jgi:hypothetical protein
MSVVSRNSFLSIKERLRAIVEDKVKRCGS